MKILIAQKQKSASEIRFIKQKTHLNNLARAVQASVIQRPIHDVAALHYGSRYGVQQPRFVERRDSLHFREPGQIRHKAHQTRHLEFVGFRADAASGASALVQEMVHTCGLKQLRHTQAEACLVGKLGLLKTIYNPEW